MGTPPKWYSTLTALFQHIHKGWGCPRTGSNLISREGDFEGNGYGLSQDGFPFLTAQLSLEDSVGEAPAVSPHDVYTAAILLQERAGCGSFLQSREDSGKASVEDGAFNLSPASSNTPFCDKV